MSFSVVYLIQRFFYRIYKFFYDWYVGGFLAIGGAAVVVFEGLDQTVAFEITLRHLFEPLYQDRTILGYILGFIFRFFRVLVGGVLYASLFLLTLAIYLAWAVIPIYLIFLAYE